MLRHVVIYKMKDEKESETLVKLFLSMEGKIPSLRKISSGSNILPSGRAYDVSLVCDFDDVEGLDSYLVHPEHVKVKQQVMNLTEKSNSVDFLF
jgi:hypothetical protein